MQAVNSVTLKHVESHSPKITDMRTWPNDNRLEIKSNQNEYYSL